MTNILRRFAKALELEKGGQNGPTDGPERRPEPSRMFSGGYQPRLPAGDSGIPKTPLPTTGSAVKPPPAMPAYDRKGYGRLKRQLMEAQQRLVERDVEIAGLKTENAALRDRIDELTGSR